jgi:hypothetical protein
METENDNNEEDFEEQLIKKIKKFYESNPFKFNRIKVNGNRQKYYG